MRDMAGSAAAPAARCRKFRRGSFILNLPSHQSITSSARARSLVSRGALGPSNRRFALQHEAVKVAALVHVIVRIGLMHDAAVIPQYPVAMPPLVAVLVFFLRSVAHQFVDQRQGCVI